MGAYLRNHCDHFIHEFYNFARSPYDMIGFDENAVYSHRSNVLVSVVLVLLLFSYSCVSLCSLLFKSEFRNNISFLEL
jgi:hypothetical protein